MRAVSRQKPRFYHAGWILLHLIFFNWLTRSTCLLHFHVFFITESLHVRFRCCSVHPEPVPYFLLTVLSSRNLVLVLIITVCLYHLSLLCFQNCWEHYFTSPLTMLNCRVMSLYFPHAMTIAHWTVAGAPHASNLALQQWCQTLWNLSTALQASSVDQPCVSGSHAGLRTRMGFRWSF